MTIDKLQIVDLERRFWDAMRDKDVESAKALVADPCLVTGPSGAMAIDPDRFAQMTNDGQWTLRDYEFLDLEVTSPRDDVAIVAYKVRQRGTLTGKPMDLQCADASTWVRNDDGWKCVLHTETILADAKTPEVA